MNLPLHFTHSTTYFGSKPDGSFSHLFVAKIALMFEVTENKQKSGLGWLFPYFKKKQQSCLEFKTFLSNIFWQSVPPQVLPETPIFLFTLFTYFVQIYDYCKSIASIASQKILSLSLSVKTPTHSLSPSSQQLPSLPHTILSLSLSLSLSLTD